MSATPFHSFIDLINFDQAILATEKSIALFKQEITDLLKQKQLVAEQFEKIKAQALDARKKVDATELEIKDLDSTEKNKKNRLENSTDYKQYQSLKSEIEHLKVKQAGLEEVLLEAWNHLENAQKELEEAKNTLALKNSDIAASIEQKNTKIVELEKDLAERNAQRHGKEVLVPQEWLDKYAMMRSRVPNPVVPVFQGACGACFYTITDQDQLQLRRRSLLQCKGCFRLLFSEEFDKETEPTS